MQRKKDQSLHTDNSTMDQMKLDQTSYCAVDRMIALLVEDSRPVVMNFHYNIKSNDKNLKKEGKTPSLVAWFSDGEDIIYTPTLETVEGTNFYNLIKDKNPELVKAIHAMFQDPATTKETKTTLNTLLTDLLEYERDIKKLLADAELVKDISIANSTKYTYCSEIKNSISMTKQRIENKYNDLNTQVEELFANEKETKRNLQIKGAILTILGAGLVVLGIALALFVAPLSGLVAGVGAVAIGSGTGFFYKASKATTTYDNTSKLISEIKEFGEKTAKEILDEKLEQTLEETPPSDYNKDLNLFIEKYNSILKSQSFGFFRCSNLSDKNSLYKIIQHAISYDNRSRKACIELGWMNENGKVLTSAPSIVQKAYSEWNEKPYMPINGFHYNGGYSNNRPKAPIGLFPVL